MLNMSVENCKKNLQFCAIFTLVQPYTLVTFDSKINTTVASPLNMLFSYFKYWFHGASV